MALILAGALAAVACSDKSSIGPGDVVTVRVVPDTIRLVLGRSDTAQAFPLDQDGAFLPNKSISWASENPLVAAIAEDGTVTAMGLGMTLLHARVGSVEGTAPVMVSPAPVIGLTTDTVVLAAVAQSGATPSATVGISNAGGATLDSLALGAISYSAGATGWLTAGLDQLDAPATLSLDIVTTGLALGQYSAVVPITAPSALNSPQTVTVVLDLTAGAPTTMALAAGDNQTAAVGSTLPVAPAVRITDQFGNPVSGVSVGFAVTAGGGALTGATPVSDASGIAAVTGWQLGTTVGTNTLSASAAGLTGSPIGFTAIATPGAASQIAINAGNGQSAVAGQTLSTPPSVVVRDQFGNPVSGVAVTFAVTGGGGSLTGAAQTSGLTGIATVGSWTLGTTAGGNSLTATAPGLTGSPVTFTATGTAGAATGFAIAAGDNQSATAGTAVTVAPSVVVTDANGNGVPGVSVTFAIGSGGGSLTGGSQTTGANGVATVGSWTLGNAAGANTLTATATGLGLLTFNATGAAGAPTQIAIVAGDGQTAIAGQTVSTPPAVRVADALNNPVSGVTVTFAVVTGGGSVTGPSQPTNAGGIATVGSWTLGATAGGNGLSATATGPGSVSFNATGIAGPPTTITLTAGNGQSATVGGTLPVAPAIRVTDTNGNGVAGLSVTFAVTAGGGSVTGGSQTTSATGAAAVGSWTLGTAVGSNTLGVTVTGVGNTSFSATALVGPATVLAKNAGDNQAAAAGTPVPVAPAVLVTDQFGNPVSGVGVTFTVAGGGGALTGGSQTTNGSGIATVGSWTLGAVAGGNSLDATAGALGTVTFNATGNPGSATTIASTGGSGQSATVGSTLPTPLSALVTDNLTNPVPGFTVGWAVTQGGGTIDCGAGPVTSCSVATNGSGATSVTWTIGTTPGPQQVTASAGGLSGSPVLYSATATVGAPATVTKNGGDNQTATVNTAVAVAPSVLVTDGFGNPVPGVGVVFAIGAGGGSVTGGNPTTNASGVATVGSWTLGTGAGGKTLTATVGALPVATFNATANADAASVLTIDGGDGQTANAGSTLPTPLSALVTDQFGNPISGVSVAWAIQSGAGTVNCGSGGVAGCSAGTDGSGVSSVSWTLGSTTLGTQQVSATSAGLSGSPLGYSATATAGPPTSMVKSAGDNQTATVNTAVAVTPKVTITDQFGNPVSGYAVTFSVSGGGGSVVGGNAVTNASGVATVTSWTMGTAAGPNSLNAAAAGLGTVTFNATGQAGTATQIAISTGNGQSATVNTAVATAPRVLVTDAFNNPVSGISVTFTPIAGGGSVTGGTQSTSAAGLATVTSWTLGTAAGTNNNTLQASAGGVGSINFTASALAGAATTISVSAGSGQTATVNTAVAVDPSVIARDAFNNPVPSVAITFTRTAGNGSVNCGAGNTTACNVTTNASGIATVTAWTMGTAAGTNNNSLSVTRTGATGTSFTASASAGAVVSFSLNSTNNQTTRPGVAVTSDPSVIALDAFSNPVPSVAITFTVTAGGGSIVCSLIGTSSCNVTTNASGIATLVSWTLSNGGAPSSGAYTNTVVASRTGATSFSFNATARYSFALDVQPILVANSCTTACHGFAMEVRANIVNVASGCGTNYITPSNTAASFLYQKIISATPACGVRMPSGGPFLSSTTSNIIRDWINNGAPNN